MPATEPSLRRDVSLSLITFYGLGNILGAGIYVLIGKIAGVAGYAAASAFLIAACAAGFSAFAFAELSSRYPTAAGVAGFVQHGFDRRWLSFGIGWLVIASALVSAATLVNGFIGYLAEFVRAPHWLAVICVVAILAAVAGSGVRLSLQVTALFTLIEGGGLIWIVYAASDAFGALPAHLPELAPGLELAAWQGVLVAAFLAFYAYTGFEDMVSLAEEVREPERNMPRAILLALGISTALYAGVALVSVLTVAPERLGQSDAPLALVYAAATGRSSTPITLISLFAIINGALIQIIMTSRMLYGMGARGWGPRWLHTVSARTRTPVRGTVLVSLVIAALAMSLPLVNLAAITSTLLLLIFTVVNLALLRIKLRQPAPAAVRVFPIWVPATGAGLSVVLLALQGFAIGT